MNQHQRKFLLEQIEAIYKTERAAVNERKPKEPSLNNYLIAAILDGSAVMRPTEEIKTKIRDRVRDLGKGDALISSSDSGWGRKQEDDMDMLRLPALVLYEEPAGYAKVRQEYEAAMKQWEADRAALESSINAMRIKVQVGSDKALETLVEQADKICSMSLTASSKLLLPSSTN